MQSAEVQTINKYKTNQTESVHCRQILNLENQCTENQIKIQEQTVNCQVVFWKTVSSKWFKELCKNLKDLDQMHINKDKLIQNRNQIKSGTRKTIKKSPITQKQFFWKTD